MKKSLLLICAISVSAVLPVRAHDHRANPFVAPLAGSVVTFAPTQSTTMQTTQMSYAPIYRDVAMIQTSEELRVLLSDPDHLRSLANDPIALQFLRERLAAREVAVSAGVSPEYLNWLYETLIASGDRLDASVTIPNFRLLPSQSVATWPQIQMRLYPGGALAPAMTATRTARVTTRQGRAIIHQTPDPRARTIAIAPTGSTVTVLAESGDWYMVKVNDQVGYAHKYDVTAESQFAVSMSATEFTMNRAQTVVAWKPDGGYDTPYGWVYPRSTQNMERIR